MSNKFLNIRVGDQFYRALMTRPSFQRNWKAVSAAFYFIRRIANLNNINHGNPASIHSREIGKIFYGYTGGAYAEYLADLEALDILKNNHSWRSSTDKSGVCQKYLVTDYGCRLLHAGDMEYLKKLATVPEIQKANKKSISGRKVMSKTYDEPVLNYHHEGLRNISFNFDEAEKMISQSCWSNAQKLNVSGGLRTFAEKDFTELEYKDGRLYHELVTLKSEARGLLNYKAMPYKAILDIRCCHPLFFSYYIINHPYTLHYVTQNREASLTLEQEHRRWIELFCDPVNDPKEVVRKRCKFKDTAHAKRAMNESLNGSKRFPAYLRWLGKEFPTLSLLWKKTDVKHTGPKIAAKYEFPLIQDRKLYELADTFGIKIMSEHDGLGVFASADDTELNKKLESLSEHIQSCSMKLFGIPAVVRTKPVYDFLDGDLHAEMAFKMSQYEKELDRLKPVADRLRRNYFSGVREPNTWKEYEAAQAKVNDLKLRYNEVLAYWAERNEKESRAEAFRKRIMEPGEDNLW